MNPLHFPEKLVREILSSRFFPTILTDVQNYLGFVYIFPARIFFIVNCSQSAFPPWVFFQKKNSSGQISDHFFDSPERNQEFYPILCFAILQLIFCCNGTAKKRQWDESQKVYDSLHCGNAVSGWLFFEVTRVVGPQETSESVI